MSMRHSESTEGALYLFGRLESLEALRAMVEPGNPIAAIYDQSLLQVRENLLTVCNQASVAIELASAVEETSVDKENRYTVTESYEKRVRLLNWLFEHAVSVTEQA